MVEGEGLEPSDAALSVPAVGSRNLDLQCLARRPIGTWRDKAQQSTTVPASLTHAPRGRSPSDIRPRGVRSSRWALPSLHSRRSYGALPPGASAPLL